MERSRTARGAKNAARVMALGAALLQSPVVPAFSQPLQTIERTVAQKLFDEIKGEDLQKGTERIIQWATTLPYEVSVSRIEASKDDGPLGEWADLRGGDLLSVDIPHMGRRSAFMRRIVAFATKNNTKQVRACVTHTHVADYLRRLKSGKMSTNELRQLKRLGVVTRVPPSVDSRGYTDSLDADGPFGTPPSFTDLQSYKVFLAGMEESAYDEDIELDVVLSVTTALGVWYYRECNEGECAPSSGEFNPRNEKSREAHVSELQARWVLYVNKEKLSGADLIASDVHRSVVKEYEAHGFKVWFVPKEMVQQLKNCKGDIE